MKNIYKVLSLVAALVVSASTQISANSSNPYGNGWETLQSIGEGYKSQWIYVSYSPVVGAVTSINNGLATVSSGSRVISGNGHYTNGSNGWYHLEVNAPTSNDVAIADVVW